MKAVVAAINHLLWDVDYANICVCIGGRIDVEDIMLCRILHVSVNIMTYNM